MKFGHADIYVIVIFYIIGFCHPPCEQNLSPEKQVLYMESQIQRGLEISKLSLGAVQLGLDYGINNKSGKPTRETSGKILRTACEGGITVVDTASGYGDSEKVVGDFFNEYEGKKPTIVTKFKIMLDTSKTAPIEDVEKILRSQVENSLKTLHLNKLPLLMFHRESEMFDYGDVLPNALKKLKSEGLVERVGVSLNSCRYVPDVLKNDLYEAVQIPLNMFDTKSVLNGGLDKLKEADIIVFIRSVFLQGLFFRDPESLPEGILQKAKEPLKKLRMLAEEENQSIAQIALTFIRDLEGVTSLVLGSETPDQVKENLQLASAEGISDRAKDKIFEIFNDIDEHILMPWTWNG